MQLRRDGANGLFLMEDQAAAAHAACQRSLPRCSSGSIAMFGELKRSMLLKKLSMPTITNTDMA